MAFSITLPAMGVLWKGHLRLSKHMRQHSSCRKVNTVKASSKAGSTHHPRGEEIRRKGCEVSIAPSIKALLFEKASPTRSLCLGIKRHLWGLKLVCEACSSCHFSTP